MLCREWPIVRAHVDVDVSAAETREELPGVTEELQLAKSRVPQYILQHGQEAWNDAIARTTPPLPNLQTPHAGVASRAYFKLKEILKSGGISFSKAVTLHLGEAPGGFVQATQEVVGSNWKWIGVSIEEAGAPRPSQRLPYSKGLFMTNLTGKGDLLREECRMEVASHVFQCSEGGADLITADGARQMDHAKLEEQHVDLLVVQTDVAIRCLKEGGTFICKFYEGFDERTMSWIAALTIRFEFVSIVKPAHSLCTNSERYIVATKFNGDRTPIPFDSMRVSPAWMRAFRETMGRISDHQCKTLIRALEYRSPLSHKKD